MEHFILAIAISGTALLSAAAPVFAGPADDTIRIASPWKIGALIPSAGTGPVAHGRCRNADNADTRRRYCRPAC